MEQYSAEKSKQNELQLKLDQLETARQEVEKITDKLGRGIEGGIKNTVSTLMAMGLQTSSSCEGHKDNGRYRAPYIELYTTAPDSWAQDYLNKELQEFWRQSNQKQREVVEPLISEFNLTRNVPPDVRLQMDNIGMLGGFRIQSTMGIDPSSDPDMKEVISAYQAEMAAFTDFLKNKFLSSEFNAPNTPIESQQWSIRKNIENPQKREERIKEATTAIGFLYDTDIDYPDTYEQNLTNHKNIASPLSKRYAKPLTKSSMGKQEKPFTALFKQFLNRLF